MMIALFLFLMHSLFWFVEGSEIFFVVANIYAAAVMIMAEQRT